MIKKRYIVLIMTHAITAHASYNSFKLMCSKIGAKLAFSCNAQRSLSHHAAPILMPHNKKQTIVSLDPFAYRIKAQEVIKGTLALGKGLPTDYNAYLRKNIAQVDRLKKMKSGEEKVDNEKDKALWALDSSWVGLFMINHIDRNPAARFVWQFVNANDELVAHRVRRFLKCYTNSCELIEWSYWNEMEKVTSEEYARRLEKMDKEDVKNIVLEESSSLSEALLTSIEKK